MATQEVARIERLGNKLFLRGVHVIIFCGGREQNQSSNSFEVVERINRLALSFCGAE